MISYDNKYFYEKEKKTPNNLVVLNQENSI